MKLYGFALLPTKDTQEKVIDFQQNHLDSIRGPVLGMQQNLPHTSVLQHPYFEGKDYETFLSLCTEVISTTWTHYFYQPTGWLFGGVVRTSSLLDLHRKLFDATRTLIDTAQIDQSKNLNGLSPAEKQNYREYGYRYLGDLYTPHITIGRTKDAATWADERAICDFEQDFSGQPLIYDRIVFYEAGDFGALKKVLCERRLK